jgi:hypothetical protein
MPRGPMKPPASFDKDRFDALVELAKFRQERDYSRRSLSWKFSLALWAVMAAAPLYIVQRPPEVALVALLLTIVIIHAWFWVNETRLRGRRDVELAFYYLDRAESLVLEDVELKPRPVFPVKRLYKFWEDMWGSGLQMLITGILSIADWYMIGENLVKS